MATLDRDRFHQEFTDAILSSRDLAGFVAAAAKVLGSYIPNCDDFGVARYYPEKRVFEVLETSAAKSPHTNRGVRTKDTDDTPGGFLKKLDKTIMINDFDAFESQSGADFRRLFPRAFESGIGSLLKRGDHLLGYMYVTAKEKNAFTVEMREFIHSVSPLVSLAFENALAWDELERLKEEADRERQYLRSEIQENWPADGLVGRSPLWKTVMGQVGQVAATPSTVLIQGETGTGKELVARAIHDRSDRAGKPLIKINCGALPENLVESELFGHERGSFTGAMGRRTGRFELADGGTIFLDEIGEMPLNLQVKLLRVLQEQEFERVGGEKPIRVDVRVIAATNRDLSQEVAAGRFRSDLYYRLNVFPISIPPLRMRPEDVEELLEFFLQKAASRLGKGAVRMTRESMQAALNYTWPGNVRELEHLVERAVILAQGNIVDLEKLLVPNPSALAFPGPDERPADRIREGGAVRLKEKLVDDEKAAIEAALAECNGVVGGRNGAAARLGMKRQTLQSKMKKYGIDQSQTKGGGKGAAAPGPMAGVG